MSMDSNEQRPSEEADYVSTGYVARRLKRSRRVILRWCESGKIAGAVQPVPGARWMVPLAWLEDLLAAVKPRRAAR